MRLVRGWLVLGLMGACSGACLGGVATPDDPSGPDGGLPDATIDVGTTDDANFPTDDASDATQGSDTSSPAMDGGVDASDGSFDGAVLDASSDAEVDASADAGGDAGEETVVSVVTGGKRTCFVMSSGRLFCAGAYFSNVPTLVPGVTDAVEVTIGGDSSALFVCFRRVGGTVECWGENTRCQLGDGTNVDRPTPAAVVGLTDAVQLSASRQASTCARRANGTVVCWGNNTQGNLGDGTTTQRSVPTPVVGLTDAVDLAVGDEGACAIRSGGQVVCWGSNKVGELGDGTFNHGRCAGSEECSKVPVPVPAITDAVAIARGSYNVHALRADGSVWSWGSNHLGGIGDGKSSHATVCPKGLGIDCAPTPVAVNVPYGGAVKISAGAAGACALHANGEVSCWGADIHGELGNDVVLRDSYGPVGVKGIADAQSISRTGGTACVMRHYGRISCWGIGVHGNLANGASTNTPLSTDVLNPAGSVCSSDKFDKGCVFPP